MGTTLLGARHLSYFYSGYFGYRGAVKQFLICTGLKSCQRYVMDTSLSDSYCYNWGMQHYFFDAERVHSPDNITICKENSQTSIQKLGIFN